MKKGWSVREAEAAAAKLKHPAEPKKKKAAAGAEYKAIEERLRKTFGTKVSIETKSRGGRIVIEYYSTDELDRILEKLG